MKIATFIGYPFQLLYCIK